MKNLTQVQSERIKIAWGLLCEPSTSLEKVQKISELLKGFDPKVDKQLAAVSSAATKIDQIKKGAIIDLSLEKLPDKTEKQKKRKKMILLFLSRWRDLNSEVQRLNSLATAQSIKSASSLKDTKVIKAGQILTTLKGPLGLITIAAAGIVAVNNLLINKSVDVTVVNQGCRPIRPLVEAKINLPGLKLPSSPINSGSQDTARLPALNLTITSSGSNINLTALGLSRSYSLPGEIKDIVYDGRSLIGNTTNIDLSSSKQHKVVVVCQ